MVTADREATGCDPVGAGRNIETPRSNIAARAYRRDQGPRATKNRRVRSDDRASQRSCVSEAHSHSLLHAPCNFHGPDAGQRMQPMNRPVLKFVEERPATAVIDVMGQPRTAFPGAESEQRGHAPPSARRTKRRWSTAAKPRTEDQATSPQDDIRQPVRLEGRGGAPARAAIRPVRSHPSGATVCGSADLPSGEGVGVGRPPTRRDRHSRERGGHARRPSDVGLEALEVLLEHADELLRRSGANCALFCQVFHRVRGCAARCRAAEVGHPRKPKYGSCRKSAFASEPSKRRRQQPTRHAESACAAPPRACAPVQPVFDEPAIDVVGARSARAACLP